MKLITPWKSEKKVHRASASLQFFIFHKSRWAFLALMVVVCVVELDHIDNIYICTTNMKYLLLFYFTSRFVIFLTRIKAFVKSQTMNSHREEVQKKKKECPKIASQSCGKIIIFKASVVLYD